MKKTLTLLAIATLTGCATVGGGSNTQVFNGQTYTIMKGELGREVSTFIFQNKQSPNQFIIVERNLKLANDSTGDKFRQGWMQKEQQYRTNDCQITQKHTDKTAYYVCEYQHKPARVLYAFNHDNNNVYVKMWIDNNTADKLSLDQEQAIANRLVDFYLP